MLAKNNLIRVGEVVSYINSNLKDKIQGQIIWTSGSAPSGFPRTNLSGATTLSPISTINIGEVGTMILIDKFYAGLQTMLLGWSCVRRVRFVYFEGNNNNGAAVTYHVSYDSTQLSNMNSGYQTDIFAKVTNKQAKGDYLIAEKIFELVQSCYDVWNSSELLYYEHYNCHNNCHNNCHGSGGWR